MATDATQQAQQGPPKFMNNLIVQLLRSPLHRLLSNFIMALTFTGRKSGKQYTLPVGYVREGNSVMLFTDHNWYKNLLHQAPVVLYIQGKRFEGVAEVITDKQETAEQLLAFVRKNPRAARPYGITIDANKQPDPASAQQTAKRFTMVRIHLS